MTIFLINRHISSKKEIQIDVQDFNIKDESLQLYSLSKLPKNETFVSHTQNALKVKQIDKPVYHISVELEPLSVNAITLRAAPTSANEIKPVETGLKVYPNPAHGIVNIEYNAQETSLVRIELYNGNGQKLATLSTSQSIRGINHFETNLSKYPTGFYWIKIDSENFIETRKIIIK